MERLLLIGDETFGIHFFKLKVYSDDIKSYVLSEREVQIRRGDEVIKLESVNNIINEFDEHEREKISYERPKIIMITFSNKEFLLDILMKEEFPEGIFVDDLKHIVKLEEFIEKNK